MVASFPRWRRVRSSGFFHRAKRAPFSSLACSKTVSPHGLRHTCAMRLLESGCDLATISLWLGHENPRTSLIYLHAHLALKERALARATPPNTKPGRYRPPDRLLAFLDQL